MSKPPEIDFSAFTPEDSPLSPQEMMADPKVQDLSTPKLAVGDPAFDFELPVCDFREGVERETSQIFRLSEVAKSRPVALIFGSYT